MGREMLDLNFKQVNMFKIQCLDALVTSGGGREWARNVRKGGKSVLT